jgi:hypothetical protein
MIGQIYSRRCKAPVDRRTPVDIVRFDAGSYTLSVLPGGQPVVCSSLTGKYFVLPWTDIIDLAIKAGINATPKEAA